MSAWLEHVDRWKDCTRCPLCEQRFRICLARGTVPCDVLFVGEAPGAVENDCGQPFVGPAGALLDQIAERALPSCVTYAMTNLVACFPAEAKARGENEPERSEILACRPRLIEFVNIARPRLIVCVGVLAAHYVPHNDTVECIDIVHPAHILARLPTAQKGMAVNRCVVQIRCAVDNMQCASTEFREWGTKYAAEKSSRRGFREAYDAVNDTNDDRIPF